MTELLPYVAALLAAGAFAGILAGLLGVGGGIVLVPAFAAILTAAGYGAGDLMQVCLATSLSTIFVTSIRSVLAHNRKGAVDWDILRAWAPWIMLGAIVGVWLVSRLSTQQLKAIFGVLVLCVASFMLISRADWRLADTPPEGARRAALGGTVGLVGVLLGIGGGSLGVPMLTLHGRPMHRAVATSAGFGAVIALPSVLAFLFVPAAGAPPGTVGSVNLPIFALTIAMTLLTAPIGANLAHGTDARRLRRIFAVFLLAVGLNMLRKALL
ncbi:MAG: sulfite exporter TauE/SafE family protein [Kocuria rhizophila]|uniref:Probable membrane transporter protein n=2 Tax=Paracoccus TaxID=265 RepID=A0A1H2ZXZ2_9RHOB|nr:sulfite exporter TauE/SafE family protein [Paracoccus sanguinis]KGJ17802.1 membrane protein [Paracoccus sanguinis]PZP21382.1 MAG: sulfite exporter TauE/SafE family protein [Kocuria rhizophila]SDX21808.1 Uncharacterized membrane protein YfcA [Paracoccus sanguinis]